MLVEFSMFPLDKGESVGSYVSRSLKIIEKSGLDYRLNSMGTVVEGEWDQVFAVIKQCYEAMQQDCSRIELTVKADYRKGRTKQLEDKIKSLETKLGHTLKK